MAVVYTSATFANAYEYRRRTLSYPFRNDPTICTVITRYYEVVSSSYTAPVLDTVDTEFTSAYCTTANPVQHVDGELMRYEVQFATIPVTHSEYESFPYRYPGFFTTETLGAAQSIFAITLGFSEQDARRYVSGDGLSENDIILESITWQVATSSVFQQAYRYTTSQRQIVTSVDANSYQAPIYVPNTSAGGNVNFIEGSVKRVGTSLGARGPAQRIVASRRQLDYFLPGITTGINSPADITLQDEAQFLDAAGSEVDILTDLTTPTQATYLAGIAAKSEFPVESGLRRVFGNIHEREVRYLPYK